MSLLVDSLRRIAISLYGVGSAALVLFVFTVWSQCAFTISTGVLALALACMGAAWRLRKVYRGLDEMLGRRLITHRYQGD